MIWVMRSPSSIYEAFSHPSIARTIRKVPHKMPIVLFTGAIGLVTLRIIKLLLERGHTTVCKLKVRSI
jgi:hypothetical protein